MIDEWYDRNYLEYRAELHAGIIKLLVKLVRSIRKSRAASAGENSCATSWSSPSPPR